jgi:hypothetical protein
MATAVISNVECVTPCPSQYPPEGQPEDNAQTTDLKLPPPILGAGDNRQHFQHTFSGVDLASGAHSEHRSMPVDSIMRDARREGTGSVTPFGSIQWLSPQSRSLSDRWRSLSPLSEHGYQKQHDDYQSTTYPLPQGSPHPELSTGRGIDIDPRIVDRRCPELPFVACATVPHAPLSGHIPREYLSAPRVGSRWVKTWSQLSQHHVGDDRRSLNIDADSAPDFDFLTGLHSDDDVRNTHGHGLIAGTDRY